MPHFTGARPNAALLYAADGYTTDGRDIKGRHAAGEGFLHGLLRHGGLDKLILHSESRAQAEQCARANEALLAGRVAGWIPLSEPQALSQAGTLFVPGPDLGGFAWTRQRCAEPRGWSLCGVTHTIASKAAVGAIRGLLRAPIQPWDALVCTSLAVRAAALYLLESEREYLEGRIGARVLALPRLPVIPLGVESASFAPAPLLRAQGRRALEAGLDTTVVLFVGRLSFHAKAHPAPMYLALERAARATGKPVVLLCAGWFANEAIRRTFVEDAARLCPSVRVVFQDGRKSEVRARVWHAADIFCSLSDNIQETFGLTPIEAMAAGLPVVVSDWDGYRESVREGLDGLRIPTRAPAAGTSLDLGQRFAQGIDNYDGYCAYSSQFVEVDIGACAQAFRKLIEQPELRRKLGETGRERARSVYDWSVVVRQYQGLWAELAESRRSAAESAAPATDAPLDQAGLDPFAIYAGYPTETLAPTQRVTLAAGPPEERLDELLRAPSAVPGQFRELLPTRDELLLLLQAIDSKAGISVAELSLALPEERRARAVRALTWLGKHGLLAFAG